MLSVKACKSLKGKYQQQHPARSEEAGSSETGVPRPQEPTPGETVQQDVLQEVSRGGSPKIAHEFAPPTSGKTSWKWKVILMIGLAIPVFLETLDYTGKWYFSEHNFTCSMIFQSWLLPRLT